MKQRVDAREAVIIPTYTLKKPKPKIPGAAIAAVAVAVLIFVTIYLPPMILEEPDFTTRASVDLTGQANPQAMEWANNYLRNNPDGDFDKDGLTNEVELSYNTGVFIIDNDNDGTTDYAELYLTETNPCLKDDAIINFVKNSDLKTGNVVNTPFKLHDIVMWADDYESKSRGGVLPLSDGSYNFYLFQGWVQFPGEPAAAYKVVNGTQVALKKNESGYFYIDSKGIVNVRVYSEQPEACCIVSLLGNRYRLPDNILTKVLSFILPSKGFGLITCKQALVNDLDGTWQELAITNDIKTLKIEDGQYDDNRFGRNETSLNDLSGIMAQIDNGSNVLISLMSHEVGEVYLEVYGYTSRNNLLVCNPQTGESVGVINIDPIGERVLDQSGKITSYEHYCFYGCGYSSAARHRIAVLDILTDSANS